MENRVNILANSGYFSAIDIHFARLITRFHAQNDMDIFLGAALVSRSVAEGDICLNLGAAAEKIIVGGQDGQDAVQCPPLSVWREKLIHSPAVGRPGNFMPLIIDDKDRLYLYRYWNYEKTLADAIMVRASGDILDVDLSLLKKGLRRLFPEDDDNGTSWQKIAAFTAAAKRLCVISGGPGTGKTFLIAKILSLLLDQVNGSRPNIFLSAPTGKAAARLKETVQNAGKGIKCAQALKEAIPTEAYTVHRMLKPYSDSPYFRYNEDNPLPADLVVVDEASMVDLALMSKLIQAVPLDARLILIGDKDQLASVEAGSVLGDVCDRKNTHGFSLPFCQKAEDATGEKLTRLIDRQPADSKLRDCIVTLNRSYRFSKTSGIGALSQAVNQADPLRAIDLLKSRQHKDIHWEVISSNSEMQAALTKKVRKGYSDYLQTGEPAEALNLFSRFTILCATRKGWFGVETINLLVEKILTRLGLIKPHYADPGGWYPGRPILITRNSYALQLFNGDIGITFPAERGSHADLQVCFSDANGKLRRYSPARLPQSETAYSLTVHKSQGSEFEHVLLILPDQDSPVLTKELLYTGITRAQKSVKIWANEDILKRTISRAIQRSSGLRDLLWSSKGE